MLKLNVGCGPFRAPGWVNIDVAVREYDNTRPDVVCELPMPFADRSFAYVYLGHVLEHVPWERLPVLFDEVQRVSAREALVMVVGPDVKRGARWFRDERFDLDTYMSLLEDDHSYPPNHEGPGGRHQWNCYEERVVGVLEANGFEHVKMVEPAGVGDMWPLVSRVDWQCAVSARCPAC